MLFNALAEMAKAVFNCVRCSRAFYQSLLKVLTGKTSEDLSKVAREGPLSFKRLSFKTESKRDPTYLSEGCRFVAVSPEFKPMKTRRRTQSGFTLIELMVVTVILGVLAAIALPAYSSMIRRARYAEVKHQMGTMAEEINLYRVEFGRYPSDTSSGQSPDGVEHWPKADEVPMNGYYDYEHWGVGNNQCSVQMGYVSDIGTQYPGMEINAQPNQFQEFDESLVLGIALYECNDSKGPVHN